MWTEALFSEVGAVEEKQVAGWAAQPLAAGGVGGEEFGCIEFAVWCLWDSEGSWLAYSLEVKRVVGMGESELRMAAATVELTAQREVMREKKTLGKAAFGRQKVLLMLPPECLLRFQPLLSTHWPASLQTLLTSHLGAGNGLPAALPAFSPSPSNPSHSPPAPQPPNVPV